MASLTGNQINNTYQGLLKTTDNAAISGAIDITDGAGNAAGLNLDPANSTIQMSGTGTATPRLKQKSGQTGNSSIFVPFEARDAV